MLRLQFGLYLAQLQERSKALTALNEPMIGDSLVKDTKTGIFWLQALVGKGGKLDQNDLKQNAAMPLASFLRFDPWTDQVVQMHPAFEPLLSSRDKMPFEVTPVYLKLSYYKAPTKAIDAAAAQRQRPAQTPQRMQQAMPSRRCGRLHRNTRGTGCGTFRRCSASQPVKLNRHRPGRGTPPCLPFPLARKGSSGALPPVSLDSSSTQDMQRSAR